MKIVLVRHGETPGNREKRYVGTTDESLTEEGRRALEECRAPEADRIYASPRPPVSGNRCYPVSGPPGDGGAGAGGVPVWRL